MIFPFFAFQFQAFVGFRLPWWIGVQCFVCFQKVPLLQSYSCGYSLEQGTTHSCNIYTAVNDPIGRNTLDKYSCMVCLTYVICHPHLVYSCVKLICIII